jgi:uncharacterized protein YbjT (DUF2867 family)
LLIKTEKDLFHNQLYVRKNLGDQKMSNIIMVAGATGNLGAKIVDALLEHGAGVRAVVRLECSAEKIKMLRDKGVKIFQVDMRDVAEISDACAGADCVVSALSGLRNVVIDLQKTLLDGAVKAGVPRFISSDYSLDFTKLAAGTNRNLDWRREFHAYLDAAPIRATTVFNGAFMDLLTTDMPLILYRFRRILYWGAPSVKMDMTTTDNVAEFTARSALDANTPRYLRVAGDRVSAHEVGNIMTGITGKRFRLFRAGGIRLLNFIIKAAKFFFPSANNLYPAWQGMQYMRDMMDGRAALIELDNERYPEIKWTSVKEFLKQRNVDKLV